MRGTVAKRIRKHAATKYKFLSPEPLYMRTRQGTLRLAQQCRRALTQQMKRNYKKIRSTPNV